MTRDFRKVALRPLPAAPVTWTRETDVLIVGSGAAGLSAALEASASGRRVLLITKAGLGAGSSPLAQGGLAAVTDPADSAGLHRSDTLTAGAGLCDAAAVAALVADAPAEIAWLARLGARFDAGPPGLEGGHSRPRIVHAGGDASGAEVHRALCAAVLAAPVEILPDTVALDALLADDGRVAGLLAGTATGPDGRLAAGVIAAAAVVLATGGYGQAFATTTNPAGATGDGLALAVRAGAQVSDPEFVQFHPTVLWQPGGRGQQPLITEALRGDGAVLIDARGRRLMAGRHPRGDLAPRDVVAAELHRAMAAGAVPHLWLDATALGGRRLAEHFPTVTAACRARGIDPAREPIPVAPGAHYCCGGVRADMTGATSLPGLFAIGEVAATGVHGANRLASNSLTEAITTGRRLGRLLARAGERERDAGGQRSAADLRRPAGGAGVRAAARLEMAAAMSRHAGVLRDAAGLRELLDFLATVPASDAAPEPDRPLDLATVEATNLHTICALVALAALARPESRGCHRRADAPGQLPGPPRHTTIRRHGRLLRLAVPARHPEIPAMSGARRAC
jgi:L-aspartate oxidase